MATKIVDGKREALACREVPVMAIVKQFREMAGPRGRDTHRPVQVPRYEYEKHRSKEFS